MPKRNRLKIFKLQNYFLLSKRKIVEEKSQFGPAFHISKVVPDLFHLSG